MFNQVAPAAVRATLRAWFTRWGMPAGLRLDNGHPWGGWNDVPTVLALWLAGLGLDLLFNPPRQPRFNGVVERSHQTGQAWAEPGQCATATDLQTRFDEMDAIQRDAYPVADGLPRVALWPTLTVPRQPYTLADEPALWSFPRAQAYLAEHTAARTVGANGRVRVYYRQVLVGRQHRGQRVYLAYDMDHGDWVATSAHGAYWCRIPAPEINADNILRLDLGTK